VDYNALFAFLGSLPAILALFVLAEVIARVAECRDRGRRR
jgi:hypothetical protein